MAYDFQKLLDNPLFQTGLATLGGAGNPGLLNAYNALQQQKKARLEEQERQRNYELEQAKTEQARAQAKLYERQILTAEENARRNSQFNENFMKMLERMNKGGQGGVMGSQAQPTPAAPTQPGLALPPVAVGKYGTPVAQLDNLMQTESSGNPIALGPLLPSGERAKGAFQFLDSTRTMLEGLGYPKFDPFKPQEARDAADFYIQHLVKKHNGDYAKAYADYGGFKTKDPTAYIGKIMGSPEKQMQQQSAIHAQLSQPAAPVDEGPEMEPEFTMTPEGGRISIKPSYKRSEMAATERRHQEDLQLRRKAEERMTESAKAEQAQRTQTVREKENKFYQAHQSLNLSLDTMFESAKRLKEHKGLGWITGRTSAIPPYLLPEEGRNANAEDEHLRGQIFVNASQAFRRMNETGGSVGQQSDWEGKQFVDAWARLNKLQSKEEYQTAIDNLMKNLTEAKVRMKAAYDYYHGKKKGEVPPEKFKRIVVVGEQGGRRVVKFEDGSLDFVD